MFTLTELAIATGLSRDCLEKRKEYGILKCVKRWIGGRELLFVTEDEVLARFDDGVLKCLRLNQTDHGNRRSRKDWRLRRGGKRDE